MIDPEPITYSGRSFSCEELSLIQQATRDCAGLGVTEIARTICEWLDWKRPNGQLKNHECRLLLERLQRERFLMLPPLRPSGRRGPRQVSTDVDTPPVIQATIAQLQPLLLTLVDASDSRLWRQFIERFHYLGCRVPVGAHLRYFVKSGNGQILACLLWTSPAWKIAARDRWIGWNAEQQARNLQYIVNNGRFLILPSVQVKGLASTIRARSGRQLAHDWRTALRIYAAATGNLGVCRKTSRNLLSRCELDLPGSDYRRNSDGSPSCIEYQNRQADLCSSVTPSRSAVAVPQRSAIVAIASYGVRR